MKVDSNLLLGLFIGIIVFATVYYFTGNNQPIKNSGSLDKIPIQPPEVANRMEDDVRGDLVDDLISQYSVEDRPLEGGTGSFSPFNPRSDIHGPFNNYVKKRQINDKKMEQPYAKNMYDHRELSYEKKRMMRKKPLDNENDIYGKDVYGNSFDKDNWVSPVKGNQNDNRDFDYKKNNFTLRSYEDVEDQFDVNKMLPQEEEDWFDITPLMTTKKIKGTHLIHPKVHMGVNTVASSLRNGTHDIRGDIVNPKINTGPWLQSTIEPDTNIKGICNPI